MTWVEVELKSTRILFRIQKFYLNSEYSERLNFNSQTWKINCRYFEEKYKGFYFIVIQLSSDYLIFVPKLPFPIFHKFMSSALPFQAFLSYSQWKETGFLKGHQGGFKELVKKVCFPICIWTALTGFNLLACSAGYDLEQQHRKH